MDGGKYMLMPQWLLHRRAREKVKSQAAKNTKTFPKNKTKKKIKLFQPRTQDFYQDKSSISHLKPNMEMEYEWMWIRKGEREKGRKGGRQPL